MATSIFGRQCISLLIKLGTTPSRYEYDTINYYDILTIDKILILQSILVFFHFSG